ncbi:MAG: hypothetical protein CL878_08780 [Dehalococcoidia bacterium]|nr:hypothetical protein [Dehalococcoidia bacterium]
MLHDDEALPLTHGRRERLVDAYLSRWLDYEPLERLKEAGALAKPLGALHQEISFQHISSSLELTGASLK